EEEPARIVMVKPKAYNDAPVIGRYFREGQAVIMDVTGMSMAEATRMVDFAAGLVYGCEGRIERIAEKVFLLAPADVEVTMVCRVASVRLRDLARAVGARACVYPGPVGVGRRRWGRRGGPPGRARSEGARAAADEPGQLGEVVVGGLGAGLRLPAVLVQGGHRPLGEFA